MKKPFILGAALLAAGALAWWGWTQLQKKGQDPGYREAKVRRGDLEVKVLTTGLVEPENRLELKPPIAGRVESILVQEGQAVKKGQILAWLSSSERAALLDAARAKGADELARWEGLFKPTPLLAPLDGLIIVKNVVPGQVVTAADSVLVMSDHLIVTSQVDETDIGQIKLGQKASITLDAYPREETPGHVTRIAFESKTVNNVTIYEVEVLPDRVPDFMRSGMTANVRFAVERREGVLLMPVEALRQEGAATAVLVPNPAGKGPPETREIKVGLTEGKDVEVTSGLKDGETILVPTLAKGKAAAPGNPFSPFGGGRPRGAR